MYSGTAGETNFYGTSKLSGEVRKSDKYHFDYAAVEQKGVDADGKPIYVPYTWSERIRCRGVFQKREGH